MSSSVPWFRIDDIALWRVSGNDARRYLNGQTTNNITTLPAGTSLPACVLSIKGKLVALTSIREDHGHFQIEANHALAETLTARLERYVVADDVEIELIPGPCYGLHFPHTPPPPSTGQVSRHARLGCPGHDVWFSSAEELTLFLSTLPAGQEMTPQQVELLRISNRHPAWGKELDENTLPAEAGLDRFAIDFHKGCYLGQEVVSRIESVGRVNRSLVLWSAPIATGLTDACGLHSTDADASSAVGRITSLIDDPAKNLTFGLAYVHRQAAEQKKLFALNSENTTVPIDIIPPSLA